MANESRSVNEGGRPAQCFHPGEFIREEMEARIWTVEMLADAARIDVKRLRSITDEKAPITPLVALGLSKAFGTGAEVWLGLQRSYDTWKAGEVQG